MAKSCGKFLYEIEGKINLRKAVIVVGNLVGKGDGETIVAGNPAAENLVGNSCGKIFQKILREIVVEKSCGKLLRENLVGKLLQENSCGKFLQDNWGSQEDLGKIVAGQLDLLR